MIEATYVFEWAKAPLSMNYRMHHHVKAKITADLRAQAAARAASFPASRHVEVQLTWVVTDKRRRDEENIVATLKPLCDGLVDAGVVPDDVPAFMTKLMPSIRYEPGGTPHFRLRIAQIS
ncbi:MULTISPECIES: hypothetical protein [unclassified Microbacterium]|uniref:hypothetical protein n=1 Tax=Microbacterium TaxID=33882 RepID=UPI003BA27D89